jgi:small subunit ribosomal protein S19e
LVTPNDVPASLLIERLATYLKENVDQITPPPWVNMVKTGSHVEKQPLSQDYWYTRCASLLRKIYVHGSMGVEQLKAEYGGNKGFGSTPEHAAKAGGTIIRKALQQLEAAKLIETAKPQGRKITKEGKKLLQELAESIMEELVKQVPEMAKYQKGE